MSILIPLLFTVAICAIIHIIKGTHSPKTVLEFIKLICLPYVLYHLFKKTLDEYHS